MRQGSIWTKIAAVLVMGVALASCLPEPEESAPEEPLIGVSRFEAARAACVMEGGRFGPRGSAQTFACFKPTSDANAQCTASSECEGLCLARSGTCSPVTPLTGCVEEMTGNGRVSTVCFE